MNKLNREVGQLLERDWEKFHAMVRELAEIG
jgi:hypothetical protein